MYVYMGCVINVDFYCEIKYSSDLSIYIINAKTAAQAPTPPTIIIIIFPGQVYFLVWVLCGVSAPVWVLQLPSPFKNRLRLIGLSDLFVGVSV